MASKAEGETTSWLERWRFLKQLPHRIVRDIGFTILSPPILLDSHQLPLVSPDMLGGGTKTWFDSAKWLATLEVDQVKQWFGTKSNNGRLGEQFAFCVEYVLLFSPFAKGGRNLMTYQQVTHRTALESKSRSPETGKEDAERITVEIEKEHLLIRLNHGCGCKASELGGGNMLMHIAMDATVLDGFQEPTAPEDGKTLEPVVAKDSKSNIAKVIDKSAVHTSDTFGKRKKKLLRKMQRLKDGSGVTVTIGEFDFLFEQSSERKQDSQACLHSIHDREGLSQTEETMISHWEVSVKFLLYAGPWEALGFRTPRHAAWKCSSQDREEEIVGQEDKELLHKQTTFRLREFDCAMDGWHADSFLGCFLGPHVGETLYNRKTRLINQLTLSQNKHAASLLCNLFGLTQDDEPNVPSVHSSGENSCVITSRNSDENIDGQRAKVLRVSPRALLKGYLFFECDLWCQLVSKELSLNRGTSNGGATNNSFYTELNPDHWMGWWTSATKFVEFARLPIHELSKWYIVPKLEWLSPVVIDGGDEERVQKVFSLDEFLNVASRVAEEAETLKIPRKRRFLVAELSWDMTRASNASNGGAVEGYGKWTEVSRGFVVEDTWPDSRLYEPHGYRIF